MRRALAFVFPFALVGPPVVACTIREECIDEVTRTTTSELGLASIERCGIGHCMTVARPGELLRFRLPTEPGTTTLEELEAELCTDDQDSENCEPVTGTMVVRTVHPPAEGQPVGRLDADLAITSSTDGKASIDYREQFTPMCHDVDWPDVHSSGCGPGQL